MTDAAGSALADRGLAGTGAETQGRTLRADPRGLFLRALAQESAERRIVLWCPVAAGAGVVCYLFADHEPPLWYAGLGFVLFAGIAYALRRRPLGFALSIGLCALCLGFVSAGWRTARVAAPVLAHLKIAQVEGYIEEMDFRRVGARFVLRPDKIAGVAAADMPYRVRLTIRRTPPFEAGTYVRLKARLLPPAHASLPGGYDFARDAWFARIGAVGNVLGRVDVMAPPHRPGFFLSMMMAVDRGRNALARRVDRIVGGDAGAIAAAMVTGKRDFLTEDAREVIREAGIFHIITISGVQMTLVAGIFYIGLRRLLAASATLALRFPIKKWAAAAAILAAIFYDVLTGSRVGTERALIMTVIMLTAVLIGRQSLSMRNLAFAASVVIVIEPEAVLGASFQLSFAAVAALVAVYEARTGFRVRQHEEECGNRPAAVTSIWRAVVAARRDRLWHGPLALLFATFCATAATASFMAYDFHELSPYVLIGNLLTLTMIEIFAVPGALIGTFLYPLGLDAFVWHYVGTGIAIVMWAARHIGSWPGATLHLNAFAPWAIVFLALAVLSAVIWRSWLFRATAIPLAVIGLYGAMSGPRFDVAVAATGDAVALRGADGKLTILGHRPSLFAAEQWLRADADGRQPRKAVDPTACDKLGCVGILPDGRPVALALNRGAFAEDCQRATVVVTPLFAPPGCAAGLVIDRDTLAATGALTLTERGQSWRITAARATDEDRPWSPAPKRHWQNATTSGKNANGNDADAAMDAGDAESSPFD
ncbi:ComEC/Rec2 family competence protein [Methylovirgula sp. HY1]|uniref:ComEC/Rec2 family competence protein n=1 Tax=Methylovirgula sp. HY1 TaxID=2822761 RepID=UPI001C7755DA|nr:ComEC/Rec2 family competence protein [Methylovirgula sp. HY1]QXX73815.1 ComE operon protein 3 [Methylovirgula sp. HY1]